MVEKRGGEREQVYRRDERREREESAKKHGNDRGCRVPSRRAKGSGYLETDLLGKEWHGPRKMKSPKVPAWRKRGRFASSMARHRHRISVKSKGADLVARKLATKFGESKREGERSDRKRREGDKHRGSGVR